MKFDTEHGIQALYKEAQGQYREHWFSTVLRDFVIDPQLINPQREFRLDTTFLIGNTLSVLHTNPGASKGTQ
jgi:hypothetical protein